MIFDRGRALRAASIFTCFRTNWPRFSLHSRISGLSHLRCFSLTQLNMTSVNLYIFQSKKVFKVLLVFLEAVLCQISRKTEVQYSRVITTAKHRFSRSDAKATADVFHARHAHWFGFTLRVLLSPMPLLLSLLTFPSISRIRYTEVCYIEVPLYNNL